MSAGGRFPLHEIINATDPATCGAACDVPVNVISSVSDKGPADVILTPGAKTSILGPKLVLLASLSKSMDSILPTVMASGADAGESRSASCASLPAATTT